MRYWWCVKFSVILQNGTAWDWNFIALKSVWFYPISLNEGFKKSGTNFINFVWAIVHELMPRGNLSSKQS